MDSDDADKTFGNILKMMVASGVQPDALGRFATMYSSERLSKMAALPAPEMGPVFEEFATTVTTSVLDRLYKDGVLAIRPISPQKPTPRKIAPPPKIIRLKLSGKQTSVSLSHPLFGSAIEAFGSEAAATNVIKQLAAQAPSDAPRSTYMQEQLAMAIAAERTAKGSPESGLSVH